MSHSSHKASKNAIALIKAIEAGHTPVAKKPKQKQLAKVIVMVPAPVPVFSVIRGTVPDRTTLWASWPLITSYKNAGSAPDERW